MGQPEFARDRCKADYDFTKRCTHWMGNTLDAHRRGTLPGISGTRQWLVANIRIFFAHVVSLALHSTTSPLHTNMGRDYFSTSPVHPSPLRRNASFSQISKRCLMSVTWVTATL